MKSTILIFTVFMLFASQLFAAEHTVQVKNTGAGGIMIFEPEVLNVAVGDTVTFVPTDAAHNSQSVDGLIPAGATPWNGALSEKITVAIDKEGVYVYKCLPHAMMAMVGVIVAGEPTNLGEIKANVGALSSTFVTNKDRLNAYLAQIK